MRKTLLAAVLISVPCVSAFTGSSPYPGKYINVAGHTVEYEKDLPKDVRDELAAKNEKAVNDIVAVYEQIDWTKWGDASCLDKFLIQGCNEIMRKTLRTNKNARLKVRDILDKNPATNARYVLLAIIQGEQIREGDLIPTVAAFSADSVKEVRIEAVKILSNQKDPQCIPHLKKILAAEQDKCIKVLAAEGLAGLDDSSGYGELSKDLDDADHIVRLSAARSLGNLATGKSRVLLERALNAAKTENNPSVRAAIAESYRKITGISVNEIRARYFDERPK